MYEVDNDYGGKMAYIEMLVKVFIMIVMHSVCYLGVLDGGSLSAC